MCDDLVRFHGEGSACDECKDECQQEEYESIARRRERPRRDGLDRLRERAPVPEAGARVRRVRRRCERLRRDGSPYFECKDECQREAMADDLSDVCDGVSVHERAGSTYECTNDECIQEASTQAERAAERDDESVAQAESAIVDCASKVLQNAERAESAEAGCDTGGVDQAVVLGSTYTRCEGFHVECNGEEQLASPRTRRRAFDWADAEDVGVPHSATRHFCLGVLRRWRLVEGSRPTRR